MDEKEHLLACGLQDARDDRRSQILVKKKFAMNPNSEPTNNVTKPNTMSFFSETKSPGARR